MSPGCSEGMKVAMLAACVGDRNRIGINNGDSIEAN
jgi:hypothetical protein